MFTKIIFISIFTFLTIISADTICDFIPLQKNNTWIYEGTCEEGTGILSSNIFAGERKITLDDIVNINDSTIILVISTNDKGTYTIRSLDSNDNSVNNSYNYSRTDTVTLLNGIATSFPYSSTRAVFFINICFDRDSIDGTIAIDNQQRSFIRKSFIGAYNLVNCYIDKIGAVSCEFNNIHSHGIGEAIDFKLKSFNNTSYDGNNLCDEINEKTATADNYSFRNIQRNRNVLIAKNNETITLKNTRNKACRLNIYNLKGSRIFTSYLSPYESVNYHRKSMETLIVRYGSDPHL